MALTITVGNDKLLKASAPLKMYPLSFAGEASYVHGTGTASFQAAVRSATGDGLATVLAVTPNISSNKRYIPQYDITNDALRILDMNPTASASAQVTSGNTETFALADGQTLTISIDGAGASTVTFNATASSITDDNYYPVADQDTKTVIFDIDGSPQTVTFAGATTTAANVRDAFNAQLTGASATLDTSILKAASKLSSASATYNLAAGDTCIVDVDNVGGATATWDATAASITCDAYYPVADQDTLTLDVTVDGGAPQTVTFAGATTTAVHVRDAINTQTTDCTATLDTSILKAATKVCGNAETYNMAPGDTMVIDVDNVGNATCTWDAAQGTITDTTAYPCADQDGLTSLITIDGGGQQVVTFSGATTTAANIASQMNSQLLGCSVAEVGGQVKITSDKFGTSSSVAAAAGTGGLTWAAAVAGTGDVADIDAVTAAEVKTVIEADSTATVSIASGVPTLVSPTTGLTSELDFISGNALAILGLSVETIVGTAAQVKVTSDKAGTDSSITLTPGTSTITWLAPVASTGDVADIDAVTIAEVKSVIEADTTATVTDNLDGTFTVVSPTTGLTSELDFTGGTGLAALGLAVETIVGTAAQVKVTSDTVGTDSVANVTGGTHTMTFLSSVASTGDVADISAVTGAEVAALIDADLTPDTSSSVSGGAVTISTVDQGSTASVQVTGGTANAAIGFDTNLHTGSDTVDEAANGNLSGITFSCVAVCI